MFNFPFQGDLQNEESVLEWLIDDENRELADEIEEVNGRMLERLLDESLFLAVFFCNIFFIFIHFLKIFTYFYKYKILSSFFNLHYFFKYSL